MNVPLTEPSALLASFTPDASKKLLADLLNDPALRPGVTAHIQTHLAVSFPAYLASISKRADRATEPLREPEDHREKGIISIGDLAKACAPFLHDVVRAARVPIPGAAKGAFELLREIHADSEPDYDHVADGEEERAEFEEAVDGLMVALLKRMREEGEKNALDEKWLENLRKDLTKTAKYYQENFLTEGVFSETILLLEEWLEILAGSEVEEV